MDLMLESSNGSLSISEIIGVSAVSTFAVASIGIPGFMYDDS